MKSNIFRVYWSIWIVKNEYKLSQRRKTITEMCGIPKTRGENIRKTE